jgi:hypothetical protein
MHTVLRSNVTQPVHWGPLPYRGCELCDHGGAGERHCRHPEVRAAIEQARGQYGACGPEAKFLAFEGMRA